MFRYKLFPDNLRACGHNVFHEYKQDERFDNA